MYSLHIFLPLFLQFGGLNFVNLDEKYIPHIAILYSLTLYSYQMNENLNLILTFLSPLSFDKAVGTTKFFRNHLLKNSLPILLQSLQVYKQ